jgi:hypothetical protein
MKNNSLYYKLPPANPNYLQGKRGRKRFTTSYCDYKASKGIYCAILAKENGDL